MAETLVKIWRGLREHNPDPVFRKLTRLLAAVFLFVVALLLYAPALGTTRFIYGTDTVSHDYVMHYYGWVKSVAGLGEIPLWNPYLFSGLPMIGSAALCPFYPTQWLYYILPFNLAFTLQYVFAVGIGGIGAAWWMRTLGHRRSVCVWAGFLYMVSGHFLTLTHAGHLQKMIALGWTPVALGATFQLVRLAKSGYRSSQLYKTAALLGLALGMQLLASHPQILYATAGACFLQLFGMALASVKWKDLLPSANSPAAGAATASPTARPVGQALLMTVLALFVCCVVGAVQLFPSLEMSAQSNRAGGVNYAEAVETSYPPLEIFEYAIPRIFGDSVSGATVPYFGNWGERIVSDYIGLPVLFLAALGVFGSRRRYRWFLLVLFFAGLLIGLGRYLPVYWLLYHVLPGFSGFRSPGTFMFLSNCALIGLSAFGLEYLINLAVTVNDRGWGSSFDKTAEDEAAGDEAAYQAARPPLTETQPFVYHGTDTPPHNESIDYEDDPGYSFEYSTRPGSVTSSNFTWDTENIPWLGRPSVLVCLAAVAVTALIAAVIALGENWGVDLKTATKPERVTHLTYSRIAGASVAIMVLCAGLLLLRLKAWVGASMLAVAALAFPLINNYYFLRFEPLLPYMRHLTKQPDLLKLEGEAAQPVRLLERNLFKNEAMLYNVGSPAGYHPIISGNYANALSALDPASDAFGSLFAVNYARTTDAKPPADGHWVPNADTSGTLAPRANSSVMWRRAEAAPYFRDEVELVKQDLEDGLSMTSASLRSIAMDVTSAGEEGPSIAGPYLARVSEFDVRRYRLYGGKQMAEGTLQRWTPHEIRLHARAAAPAPRQPAVLPLSEPASPGWYAETSTGMRLPLIDINGLQRGLVLPPGDWNVRLVYSPYSFRLGLFVSLMGATILLGFGMGTLSRRIIKGKKKVEKALRQGQGGSA